ncbi:MAG: tRNA lysidine(34) synthetase TilS [Bdellovibrionales bacterium]|nr:tRNA lysidine(34) synthetase TilS [Bdellovibrionales bacterium]
MEPTPASETKTKSYVKPSDIGGTLIRRVIALFKSEAGKNKKFSLPLKGKIAISVSGGVDSMVLAHLICTYGRKIVANPREQITLLHFDHQWREESGTSEKRAIEEFAARLGVKFESVALASPRSSKLSNNLEDDARQKRREAYDRLRKGRTGFKWILSAHHEDDLIETLVWRFFRGELLTHKDGILFHHDGVLRPFLKVRKEEILAYSQAEDVPFHEDPTNRLTHHMRAYFRHELFPQLEVRFPGFKASIMQYIKSP